MQWVYFVRMKLPQVCERCIGNLPRREGPVKIGVAADVARRLNELRTACPYRLKLLGYMPGGLALERELHERFALWRLEGEWFDSDADGLQDLIEEAGWQQDMFEFHDAQVCDQCGRKPVIPPRQVFCSDECADQRAQVRSREWKRLRSVA